MSGRFITLRHFRLLKGRLINAKIRLSITIILGIYFSILQGYEYNESIFTVRDSIFGAIFFVSTGFHGLHVLIGRGIIIFILVRMLLNHFNDVHCFGFEARA
jgi:heme/copper-type cytochrome/quinol oxidase subunit 3